MRRLSTRKWKERLFCGFDKRCEVKWGPARSKRKRSMDMMVFLMGQFGFCMYDGGPLCHSQNRAVVQTSLPSSHLLCSRRKCELHVYIHFRRRSHSVIRPAIKMLKQVLTVKSIWTGDLNKNPFPLEDFHYFIYKYEYSFIFAASFCWEMRYMLQDSSNQTWQWYYNWILSKNRVIQTIRNASSLDRLSFNVAWRMRWCWTSLPGAELTVPSICLVKNPFRSWWDKWICLFIKNIYSFCFVAFSCARCSVCLPVDNIASCSFLTSHNIFLEILRSACCAADIFLTRIFIAFFT